MSATCEDELICDFAETYHIFNWRELPVKLAATLAAGLPEQSRTKMKLRGDTVTIEQVLLAQIADLIAHWIFINTTGGRHPESLVKALTTKPENPPVRRHRVFKNGEDFDKELARYIKEG